MNQHYSKFFSYADIFNSLSSPVRQTSLFLSQFTDKEMESQKMKLFAQSFVICTPSKGQTKAFNPDRRGSNQILINHDGVLSRVYLYSLC